MNSCGERQLTFECKTVLIRKPTEAFIQQFRGRDLSSGMKFLWDVFVRARIKKYSCVSREEFLCWISSWFFISDSVVSPQAVQWVTFYADEIALVRVLLWHSATFDPDGEWNKFKNIFHSLVILITLFIVLKCPSHFPDTSKILHLVSFLLPKEKFLTFLTMFVKTLSKEFSSV